MPLYAQHHVSSKETKTGRRLDSRRRRTPRLSREHGERGERGELPRSEPDHEWDARRANCQRDAGWHESDRPERDTILTAGDANRRDGDRDGRDEENRTSVVDETGRVLFHTGRIVTAWLGAGFPMYWINHVLSRAPIGSALGAVRGWLAHTLSNTTLSPVADYADVVLSHSLPAANVAWRWARSEWIDAAGQTLICLPYSAMLDANSRFYRNLTDAKQAIDHALGLLDPMALDPAERQAYEFAWMLIGGVALGLQFDYFARATVALPGTGAGQAVLKTVHALKYVAQGYAILRTAVGSQADVALTAHDGTVSLTLRERAVHRRKRNRIRHMRGIAKGRDALKQAQRSERILRAAEDIACGESSSWRTTHDNEDSVLSPPGAQPTSSPALRVWPNFLLVAAASAGVMAMNAMPVADPDEQARDAPQRGCTAILVVGTVVAAAIVVSINKLIDFLSLPQTEANQDADSRFDVTQDVVVEPAPVDCAFLTHAGRSNRSDALSVEEVDLALLTVWRAPDDSARGPSDSRVARSVQANDRPANDSSSNDPPAARRFTVELERWFAINWRGGESGDAVKKELTETAGGVYRNKKGKHFVKIANKFWRFLYLPKNALRGHVFNPRAGASVTIERVMPNYIWQFSAYDRKRLKLGPRPAADRPALARVTPSLRKFVDDNWDPVHSNSTASKGGIRFRDGLYENRDGNTFLKVSGVFWPFKFKADVNNGEIINPESGLKVSISLTADGWEPRFEKNADNYEWVKVHALDRLLCFDAYSPDAQHALKAMIGYVFQRRISIRYSELLRDLQALIVARFLREYRRDDPELAWELLAAQGEIICRIAAIDNVKVGDSPIRPASLSANTEEDAAGLRLLSEFRRSMLPDAVNETIFRAALAKDELDEQFSISLSEKQRQLDRLKTEVSTLQSHQGNIESDLENEKARLVVLDRERKASGVDSGPLPRHWLVTFSGKIYNSRIKIKVLEAAVIEGRKNIESKNSKIIPVFLDLQTLQEAQRKEKNRVDRYYRAIADARNAILRTGSSVPFPSEITGYPLRNDLVHMFAYFRLAARNFELKRRNSGEYDKKDLDALEMLGVGKKYIVDLWNLTRLFATVHECPFFQQFLNATINLAPPKIDYNDILFSRASAIEIYYEMTNRTDVPASQAARLEEYYKLSNPLDTMQNLAADDESGVLLAIAAMVYWVKEKRNVDALYRKPDSEAVLKNFLHAQRKFTPVLFSQKLTDDVDFLSIHDLKDSNQFTTQLEFTDQFSNYTEKYSKYEAEISVVPMILSAGLSDFQLYGQIKKAYRFGIHNASAKSRVPGEFVFIQLCDGDWLMISALFDAMTINVLTDAQMKANPYLNVVRLNPYRRKGGGSQWTEVYDYRFEMSFPDQKKNHLRDWARAVALRQKFIVPVFGNNTVSDDKRDWLKLVFNEDHTAPSTEKTVFEVGKKLMQDALNEIAGAMKDNLYQPSGWQRFALLFVPLYADIYHSQTDRSVNLSISKLVMDAIGLFTVVSSMGGALGKLGAGSYKDLARAMARNRIAGLSGPVAIRLSLGKALSRSAGSSMAFAKIIKNGVFDLLEPLPYNDAFGKAISATGKISRLMTVSEVLRSVADQSVTGIESETG